MADPASRLLVLMVKEPRIGWVKSRLARGIGWVAATAFQRNMQALLVRRLAPDPRWQTILAVAPDRAMFSPMLPAGTWRVPQGTGDLGNRMGSVFANHPGQTVLITGTDIPGMTAAHVARAFVLAERHGAVLGPAGDGGYWCIGLRRGFRPPDLFANVRWSSEHALADTCANLPEGKVAIGDELDDVDG